MRNFLVMIGWKRLDQSWDKTEIKIDLLVVAAAYIVASVAVCYG